MGPAPKVWVANPGTSKGPWDSFFSGFLSVYSQKTLVFGRIAVPKDFHVIIPKILEYVPLHGSWDFAYVIKLRTLR